jgi:hypothetical protein
VLVMGRMQTNGHHSLKVTVAEEEAVVLPVVLSVRRAPPASVIQSGRATGGLSYFVCLLFCSEADAVVSLLFAVVSLLFAVVYGLFSVVKRSLFVWCTLLYILWANHKSDAQAGWAKPRGERLLLRNI